LDNVYQIKTKKTIISKSKKFRSKQGHSLTHTQAAKSGERSGGVYDELKEPMESQMRAGIPISLWYIILQKEAQKESTVRASECELGEKKNR